MKIRFIAVGKLKKPYIQEGLAEYVQRISRHADVKIVEVREERDLLAKAEGHYAIALDPAGQQMTSEKFAEMLQFKEKVAFLIGPARGLSETTLKGSNLRLSLSKMTLQHDLAQLVLAEQLYRAFTILNNHPYHK